MRYLQGQLLPLPSFPKSATSSITPSTTPSVDPSNDSSSDSSESSTLMNNLGGGIGGALSILGILISFIHRKKLRTHCCGKTISVSVENDSTGKDTIDENENGNENKKESNPTDEVIDSTTTTTTTIIKTIKHKELIDTKEKNEP